MNSLKILVSSIDHFYPPNPEFRDEKDDKDELVAISEVPEVDPVPETEVPVPPPSSVFTKLKDAVLFVPKHVVLMPLLFVWFLITYPFVSNDPDYDRTMYDIKHEDMSDKTELLKQQNLLSNAIKSPTLSSKYIIPPPQRLFPLSRNPNKKRRRKTLILDLDETLIHSLSRGLPRTYGGGNPHMIEIKLDNIATLYYVHKRPFCDFFLREIAKWYELQIFTASVKEYADPIIDWLELDIINHVHGPDKKNKLPEHSYHRQRYGDPASDKRRVFTKRYYRGDCTFRQGVGYIKDLSKVFKEDDLKNVVILDNSPVSYALHENNAVVIEGWINDQLDRDLLNLLPMLHSLSLCIDVRYVLGIRQGEKAFES